MAFEGDIIYSIVLTIVAAFVAVLVYWVAHSIAVRVLSGFIDRRLLLLLEFIFLMLAASLFLGVMASVYDLLPFFIMSLSIFIIGSLTLLFGLRHVIEEYFVGLAVVKAHDLRIGDYIELDGVKGHIIALEDTAIVVRDPKRDLAYVPYTKLVHSIFKRFRVGEGHEVRVHIPLPYGIELRKVREEISRLGKQLGMENVRVDVETVTSGGIVLVVRGIIRDPRREEEVKYAMLDHVYMMK